MSTSPTIAHCHHDLYINLAHISHEGSKSLYKLASKISAFVATNWSQIIYYSALGASLLLNTKAFLLGASWGVFLQCFDTLAKEDVDLALSKSQDPTVQRRAPVPQEEPSLRRQYLGGAGMLVTGTLLFGPFASFIAGWSAAEELVNHLSGRVSVLSGV